MQHIHFYSIHFWWKWNSSVSDTAQNAAAFYGIFLELMGRSYREWECDFQSEVVRGCAVRLPPNCRSWTLSCSEDSQVLPDTTLPGSFVFHLLLLWHAYSFLRSGDWPCDAYFQDNAPLPEQLHRHQSKTCSLLTWSKHTNKHSAQGILAAGLQPGRGVDIGQPLLMLELEACLLCFVIGCSFFLL